MQCMSGLVITYLPCFHCLNCCCCGGCGYGYSCGCCWWYCIPVQEYNRVSDEVADEAKQQNCFFSFLVFFGP